MARFNENESSGKDIKYYQKTKDGKLILRKVMQKYIPNRVTKAVKQGFSSPDASWFRGESMNFVRKQLMRDNAIIYEFIDKKAVNVLIDEHLDGKQNRRLLIWSLLNVEQWCKEFLV